MDRRKNSRPQVLQKENLGLVKKKESIQKLRDAITLAKSENDTKQVKLLEKVLTRIEKM